VAEETKQKAEENTELVLDLHGHAQLFFESAIAIPQLDGSTSAIAIPQLFKEMLL
jgi:hypothetical protein